MAADEITGVYDVCSQHGEQRPADDDRMVAAER